MKNFLLCLLLFASSLWTAQTAFADGIWAVTDTAVADGYYRLHVRQWTGTTTGIEKGLDSVMCIGDVGVASATYAGINGLFVKSHLNVTAEDWGSVWHIWKAGMKNGHQTYHVKNCGTGSETYFIPCTMGNRQSDYTWTTGTEQDSVYLRVKDWGSSKESGDDRTTALDRQDQTKTPGYVFMVPTTSAWRYRVGGSKLVKLNSYSRSGLDQWYLENIDLGEKTAWMTLNEAMTDAKGPLYEVGENPGMINSQTAMEAFETVMNEAQTLFDEGGTDESYLAMAARVRTAQEDIKKYQNPLSEGYYVIKTHYAFSGGYAKWMVPYNDYQTRAVITSGSLTSTTTESKKNSYVWHPAAWWFGYEIEIDKDETSLPQQYIWHFKKAPDGNFTMKSCAEDTLTGDSTYFQPLVTSREPVVAGRDYWCDFAMCGTPRTTIYGEHTYYNWYRFYCSDNPYYWNLGNKHFQTANPTNSNTYALWEVIKVPDSRITAKFRLNEAITDAGGVFNDWTLGDNPGNLKKSISDPLVAALASARAVYTNTGASDVDYTAATTSLTSAYNATMEQLKDTVNALVPITEGYYYLRNADYLPQYVQGDSAIATAFAGSDNYVYWDVNYLKNLKNPDYIWKIAPLANGTYSMQNLGTGKYVSGDASASAHIPLTDTQQVGQILDNNYKIQYIDGYFYRPTNLFASNGWYSVFNELSTTRPWHNYAHGSGTATGPNFMEQYLNMYTIYYKLEKITDQHLLDSLIAKGTQKALNLNMYNTLVAADNALDKTKTYSFNTVDSLIYEAGAVHLIASDGSDSIGYDITKNQFNSNNRAWNEGSYAGLIDGTASTYFHTRYSTAGGPLPTEDSYLQVDLRNKPQQTFVFKYTRRGNSTIANGALGITPTRYGITDNGDAHRPTNFTITAANDTVGGTTWKEVKVLTNLPTIPQFYNYYSPAIVMDQPYRYIRFSVHNTKGGNNYNGHVYWDAGEWQVYPATYNEANSPYFYSSDVKTAADQLSDVITTCKAQYAAGLSTQDAIDQLTAATAALQAVNVDTMKLVSRILESQVLADSSYICDNQDQAQYGDVTTEQKSAFNTAIAAAKAAIAPAAHPTQESLQAAYDALNTAYFTFNAERKTFDTNKWYYIRSLEKYNYSTASLPNFSWRGGHIVYACGNNAQDAMGTAPTTKLASSIRWGHYVGFDGQETGQTYPKSISGQAPGTYDNGHIDCLDYPYAMWRFVKLSDSVYAIQNRGTGYYLGRRQDVNLVYHNNAVTQSITPVGYKINIVGRNQFEIINIDATNSFYSSPTATAPNYGDLNVPLHQQGTDFAMVWWGTGTERGWNTGSAFTFQPVADDLDYTSYPALNNNIQIMSFPFAVDEGSLGISASTENIATYALKNVTTNTVDSTCSIQLTKKATFDAGEPFVLVTGDPATYVAGAADSVNLYITPVEEFSLTPKTANGLVAVINGDSVMKKGLGFFANAVLSVTDSTAKWIDGHTGYINPTLLTPGTGATDLTVDGKGILNQIKTVVATNENENADVYSVDGKLLRRNAKGTQATNGLSKGIYIVGKKKILVQ